MVSAHSMSRVLMNFPRLSKPRPRVGYGNSATRAATPATTLQWPRFFTVVLAVHPVNTSVGVID